jgi:hypothetical protein
MSSMAGFGNPFSLAQSVELLGQNSPIKMSQASPQSPVFGQQSLVEDSYEKKQHLSKSDAAKAGMSMSWFLGIPYGLASACFMYFLAHDIDPTKKKNAELEKLFNMKAGKSKAIYLTFIPMVLSSMLTWTLYGGIVGAISASRGNHKLKKAESDNQDSSQQSPLSSMSSGKAFMMGGAGAFAVELSTSSLTSTGLFGEGMKTFTRTIWKQPKLLIPFLGLSLAGAAMVGYVSSRMVPWMKQKLDEPPAGSVNNFGIIP